MKRPIALLECLLADASLALKVSTERDLAYLQDRFENEGYGFLTLTLPRLSDSLERGLEAGRFTLPDGFKPSRRRGSLPALLQGFFKRVFGLGGDLLDEPCPDSIYWIRQVTRLFKKPKIACTQQRESAAEQKFIDVEEYLKEHWNEVEKPHPTLDIISSILWPSVFSTFDGYRIVCNHGPGVTADYRLPNERRYITQWHDRLESSLSVSDHAFVNYDFAWPGTDGNDKGTSGIEFIELRDEPGVRVVFVPKTLSTPRVIAIEPSFMQFAQQGVARYMMERIESHRLTAGSVNFADQSVNQELARKASIDRVNATIDLSDASDRVHLALVQRIFKSSPLSDVLSDCRSLHADLPSGRNIILSKYASMGSALCFPVEACVFYTLCVTAIIERRGLRPSIKNILSVKKDIHIYGDDIIVPVADVDAVTAMLSRYLLKVNVNKSFRNSAFRESCGGDYFAGIDVKPVYARQLLPEAGQSWSPDEVMSWVSTTNQFYLKGCWKTAAFLRRVVGKSVAGGIPLSSYETDGLAFFSFLFTNKLRYNPHICGWEQKRPVFIIQKQKDKADGYNANLSIYFEGLRVHYRSVLSTTNYSEWNSRSRDIQDSTVTYGYDGNLDRVSGVQHNGWDDRSLYVLARLLQAPVSNLQVFGTELAEAFRAKVLQGLPEVSPSRTDFENSAKRGVFTLKHQWITQFS